ncbi:hypothetical protein [Sporanaerobium hydrogeniformans]|uniref:hypothetical protein n=1 Tax=Sporanaerobium hydrogeniformans TaxID=3072179 RepID=UPI0015D4B602|nr:hypothetical protein [Sporanaerobium hydrogeniformans]
MWKLYETFTHYHINRVVGVMNLEDDIAAIRTNPNKISFLDESWKNLILAIFIRATWIGNNNLESTSIYRELFCNIENIFSILGRYNTADILESEIVNLEDGYREVLEIINKLGCTEKVTIKSRLEN